VISVVSSRSHLAFYFIRGLAPLGLTFLLCLHQVFYSRFIDFELAIFSYSLCFLVLFLESIFLFFYKDKVQPISIDLILFFISALFLTSLVAFIPSPVTLFFLFFFFSLQIFSLIFLKEFFLAIAFAFYLSFLFPFSLSAGYENFDQKFLLLGFSFLIAFVFIYFYLLNLILDNLRDQNKETFVIPFDLRVTLKFLEKLKPSINQISKYFASKESKISQKVDFLSSKKAKEKVEALQKFILDFDDYIKFEPLELSQICLKELLTEVLKDLKNHPKKPSHFNPEDILNRIQEDFILKVDKSQLKIAFKNIIVNSFEACAFLYEGQEAKISINVRSLDKGWLFLFFNDNGQGIEKEDLNKVFHPFFTKRLGLKGLGLSYAKKIIELHKGSLQIESEKGNTRVIVKIPLDKERTYFSKIKEKIPSESDSKKRKIA